MLKRALSTIWLIVGVGGLLLSALALLGMIFPHPNQGFEAASLLLVVGVLVVASAVVIRAVATRV